MTRLRSLILVLLLTLPLRATVGADSRFEFDMSKESIADLRIGGCEVEACERKRGKPAYRMKGLPEQKVGTFGFRSLPRDITGFRRLRFWMRGTPGFQESVIIAFIAQRKSATTKVPGPSGDWERMEVLLPEMRADGDFDPTRVERLHFAVEGPEGYVLEISGVELARGAGGWRRTPREEAERQKARRFMIASFESTNDVANTRTTRSGKSTIFTKEPRGHAVRWHLEEAEKDGCLDLRSVPDDLEDYRVLRLRARAPADLVAKLVVRFRSPGGVLEARMPQLGEDWRVVSFHLPDMEIRGDFDPTEVESLRIVAFGSKGRHVDLDDVELERKPGGWRYSTKERYELGIDETAPFFRISNFEGLDPTSRIRTKNCDVRVVEEKKRRRVTGHYLRWTVEPGSDDPSITFLPVPQDIRPYRILRFRVRVDKQPADRLKVCFQGAQGSIRTYLKLTPGRWETMEFRLSEMRVDTSFDPENAGQFRFLYYGDRGFKFDVDDIEIVKGPGGWKLSEEEQVAFVFGEERAKKVRTTETKHFLIWTDSSAADRKFHQSLEKMHEFVCGELGVEPPEERISVYIFQNPDLYFDFCERKGWARAVARNTSGHAEGSYFATYYQAPGAGTVAHELTHSIVHHTLGTGGGAWFQEGVAVYVEKRWLKRSAAAEFAARVRSDEFVPVDELLSIPTLVRSEDLSGGPRRAGWLYAQAGAFFEFLIRGPYGDSADRWLKTLCLLNPRRDAIVREVEASLGDRIGKIQEAWVKWGGAPPKQER